MIENELKYVLRIESQDAVQKTCGLPTLIRQGYLPGKARIRSKVSGLKPRFYFTYKLPVQNVTGEDVVFEIEKDITQHEFDTLWPHTDRRLVKQRYGFKDGDVQWDIDYFIVEGTNVYFAMAEAEMPEAMSAPPSIPAFLKDKILFAVPRSATKEFTSARIADQQYALKLLANITGGEKKKKKKKP